MSLQRRIAHLEGQRRQPTPSQYAFDSEQAARAAGVQGGWFCIGAVMEPNEWIAAAKAQQAALCRGALHGTA